MKHNIIVVVKYLFWGISWGCLFFVFTCLIGFLISGEAFILPIAKDFARQALGAVIVGIACGSTSIVYQFEQLSWGAKICIHFVLGMGVFYPTAIYLHWIPFDPDQIAITLLQVFLSCCVFAVIWLCFYLYNRSEAKKINNQLRKLEQADARNT